MAITDIAVYSHLSDADIAELTAELDQIRAEVEESLGPADAAYVRTTVRGQRLLDVAARAVIMGADSRPGVALGAVMLAVAKSIENMEIGHNVSHGQWDWMNEPEIHSTGWEWDMACPSPQWKHYHNYLHHTYTNVLGMDEDIGFGVMRVSRDQQWHPIHLIQPLQNAFLALTFQWGMAIHDIKLGKLRGTPEERAYTRAQLRETGGKAARQLFKDYVFYPAISGRRWRRTAKANLAANLGRNLWAYLVIFCGHFPDGAEKFEIADIESETRGEWYLRQMLGTANFDAGPVLAFMSGNLCYQIEHHLFPDLPSNRYAEIGDRVRTLCDKYDLPYNTDSLPVQYLRVLRTIFKLALPNSMLRADTDDAPETGSERRFTSIERGVVDPHTGRRRGLRTALRDLRGRRRGRYGARAEVRAALRDLPEAPGTGAAAPVPAAG